jgi:ATP-binding cassette subfamily B (MDR/TAP) protein 1
VFDNIVYGLVGTKWEFSSRDEQLTMVKQAARTAFADGFIEKLPQGYDTRIGEKGGLLSGGQKQRLAIARSIISEPKILLLDEATSALDPHAEGIVQKALDRASKNRTTIVIAHKLKTIQNADKIVVLSRGKIVEQGRHEELMEMGNVYSHLVKAQDLSATAQDQVSVARAGDKADNTGPHKFETFATRSSVETQKSINLKDRNDFSLYKKTNLVRTVFKLVMSSWDLRYWYLVVLAACVGGGEFN